MDAPRITSGRVDLNVGGRLFETSISTLAHSSTYFASRFSNKWNQQNANNEHQQPIFIDHDPDAFAVLLSYMRYGFVKEEDLTAIVLCQAEYFGVDDLVHDVKVNAYRSHHSGFMGPDDEAIQNFDMEFGSITEAVTKGFLPALLLNLPNEAMNEYAALYFHREHLLGCDGMVTPFLAGICSKLFDPDQSSLPAEMATDAGGFMNPIFALNFLGKFGFRLAEHQNYTNRVPTFSITGDRTTRLSLQCRGSFLGEWLFVRERQSGNNKGRLSISPSARRISNRPREYASIVWTNFGTFVTGAGGEPMTVRRLGLAVVRNVGIQRMRNMALAIQWVDNKGFHKREEELEEIFSLASQKIPTKYCLPPTDPGVGCTMIFSRPLCEKDPLVEKIIPLPFREDVDDFAHHVVFPKLDVLRRLPFTDV